MKRTRLKKPRRAAVCAYALLTVLTAAGVFDAAASSAEGATGGVVRYDHTVYHNGKRVLWHGAWRGSAGRHDYARALPVKATAPEAAALQPQAPTAAAATTTAAVAGSSAPLKPFGILADPGDLVASRMAREFVQVLSDQGAQGRAIVGSTAPTGVAKVMRTDMAEFAIVTLDSLAVSVKYQPDWPKRVPLVAPLAPETIEVIASKDVKSLNDLTGKSVSFGDPDGTTGITGKLLFSRLGVTVNPTYEPLTEALGALAAGKRDAVVVLGGKEAHALDGFGDDRRFHLVAIPWSAPLEQLYAPARVAASDRPNLVAANDSVETVAAPMALVALDAPTGSPRADALGRIARAFFDNYDSTLTAARDEHWRDVNLAAAAAVANADWPRLAAAQGWVDEHKVSANGSLEAFRASAKAAEAGGGPKAEDSDRLYDSLTRWRSLMQ
ncbi:TAXI family TRAP transporter solute-binding subunit [Roseiarcus sp.]|uniref:TAXI family TRAP transporter solute-binding subunit n=1 Tax=Roseiarcus sp. TaxID=1969460 RepID=UPI003F9DB686